MSSNFNSADKKRHDKRKSSTNLKHLPTTQIAFGAKNSSSITKSDKNLIKIEQEPKQVKRKESLLPGMNNSLANEEESPRTRTPQTEKEKEEVLLSPE